jgi:hypothetical protein
VALAPLAAKADLDARGIDTSDWSRSSALLASASSAVREAAGSQITKTTSTVTIWTEPTRRLDLPSRPVHSVTSVTLDGVVLVQDVDYFVRGSGLWRNCYWQGRNEVPGEVVVTFTHGLDEVPADLVDLVCSLVAAGTVAAEDGYDPKRGVTNERVDDYAQGRATGADEVVSPMLLPERTQAWLRNRFGGGTVVVGTY